MYCPTVRLPYNVSGPCWYWARQLDATHRSEAKGYGSGWAMFQISLYCLSRTTRIG